MKNLQDTLASVLSEPTPHALVELQGALLASGQEGEARDQALEVAGHFYTYLTALQSKITARDYSELASLLDIGAVGMVALENIVHGEEEDFWGRLLMGGMAEGLMVAASRQYIKGWRAETELVHSQAAWYLSETLWHASCDMQPDLPVDERWQAIQSLLAPAYDADVPASHKAVLLGRVFQLLLLAHLARLLTPFQEAGSS